MFFTDRTHKVKTFLIFLPESLYADTKHSCPLEQYGCLLPARALCKSSGLHCVVSPSLGFWLFQVVSESWGKVFQTETLVLVGKGKSIFFLSIAIERDGI
ncbi:hypothetical protein XENORESO_006145 [Xenotaenia resolanae]|uniref:Uncharacterized protein n=1 Tax=Xenotaenia resolanae TaxID=208358 RepID=A0ABV0WVD1_9TELE